MAHWYDKDGNPRHTQPTKKGAKNPTRATTIKDGKEQGLFPSVTEYIKQLANGGIERYKIGQVVKACYERPPIADEPLDSYAAYVTEQANRDSGQAADLGTAIHDAIEQYYKNGTACTEWDQYVAPTIALVDKLGIVPTKAETVLVNQEWGYAGTADIIFDRGILDFKSQRFDKKPNVYDSHIVQLAAYHMARWGCILDEDKAYNVYISTVNPGLVVEKVWDANDLRRGWEIFRHLLDLYRLINGFDPRQPMFD